MSIKMFDILSEALRSGEIVSRDQLNKRGISPSSLSRILGEMIRAGYLRRHSHGHYGLGEKIAFRAPKEEEKKKEARMVLIVSNQIREHMHGCFEGAERVLEEHGIYTIFKFHRTGTGCFVDVLDTPLLENCHGLILFQERPLSAKEARFISDLKMPVVKFGYPMCEVVDTVSANWFQIYHELTEALMSLGAERFALLSKRGLPKLPMARRLGHSGVQMAARQKGFPFETIHGDDGVLERDLGAFLASGSGKAGVVLLSPNQYEVVSRIREKCELLLGKDLFIAGGVPEEIGDQESRWAQKLSCYFVHRSLDLGKMIGRSLVRRLNGDSSPPFHSSMDYPVKINH